MQTVSLGDLIPILATVLKVGETHGYSSNDLAGAVDTFPQLNGS
jgi:hypothetical protein